MRTHISKADDVDLYIGDVVEQAGIPYRIVGMEYDDYQGRRVAIYYVPTHNGDGEPMPADADIYRSVVNAQGATGQIRWWGPQRSYMARAVGFFR